MGNGEIRWCFLLIVADAQSAMPLQMAELAFVACMKHNNRYPKSLAFFLFKSVMNAEVEIG